MWPRLPRTVPVPPQRGQGTGPNGMSPAPAQPWHVSNRTRCSRRVVPFIDSSKLRRVDCSRSSPRSGGGTVPGWSTGSKISRKPTVSTRTRAEKSKPSKPPDGAGATGTAGRSPRSYAARFCGSDRIANARSASTYRSAAAGSPGFSAG